VVAGVVSLRDFCSEARLLGKSFRGNFRVSFLTTFSDRDIAS
jgi:hypothetical protein